MLRDNNLAIKVKRKEIFKSMVDTIGHLRSSLDNC